MNHKQEYPSKQQDQSGKRHNVQLPEPWLELLGDLFETEAMRQLRQFLQRQKAEGRVIYPPGSQIFAAFHACLPSDVRVILLGQDPYHGHEQAHGLSFSVPSGQPLPPSLQNIYKELAADLPGCPTAQQFLASNSGQLGGSLVHWASQGILLLNSVLTVEAGKPASHAGQGWEFFTDQVIRRLAAHKRHLVFLLWGSYAQKKTAHLEESQHCLIHSPHPSPLSAHRGFFGSRPFSRCNQYLHSHGLAEISW